jgi:hypothetical protein
VGRILARAEARAASEPVAPPRLLGPGRSVSSEKTLEEELAETVREAVRRAQPSAALDPKASRRPIPCGAPRST